VADAYSFPQLVARGPRVGAAGSAAERAAEIVARAETEAAAIAVQAEATGRQEGFAAGIAEARERVDPALAALAAAAEGVAAEHRELADELERRALELALALAEKVLAASLEVRPELLVEVVKGTLRRVAERDRLVICVNPDDLPILQSSLGEIAASFGGSAALELAGERRVARGGCVVRTVEGELDARIGEQLERAADVMRAALA
jgi:flagellar assembly protein FliH